MQLRVLADALRRLSIALAVALAAGAAAAQEIGVVKHVDGEVSVLRDGASRPLRAGDSLEVADRIVTGPTGSCGATLADGTTVALGADSEVDLSRFVFEPQAGLFELVLRVLRGRVIARTGLIGEEAPEKVRIETPRLTIGVRGTRFAVVLEDGP